jgi:polysaccharide chain length determinant protein (PEP-CTERM system associated)
MAEILDLLRFYGTGCWRRRWSILLVAWVVAVAGWIAVAMMPNVYTSRAEVYVDTQSILGPLLKNLAVTPDVERQVDIMRQTLLSRPNMEALVRATDLDLAVDGALAYEALLARLSGQISVRSRNRSLFEISYSSRDPREAHKVVSAVIDIFVEKNLGNAQRDVDNARAFIERQVADYERKLREAELAVADYKRSHADELGGFERGLRELEEAQGTVRRLESELQSAIWQRDQLNLQLASAPRRLSRSEVAATASPAVLRVTGLQAELDRLLLTYTDRHPNVVSLRALLRQAQEEAAREAGRGGGEGSTVPNPLIAQLEEEIRGVQLKVADLERRIGLARGDIERLARSVAQTPQVEADLVRLTRDYETLKGQHQQLLEKREAATLAKRLDSETSTVEFRIVEPPVVPVKPSGPPHGLFMIGVFVGALGAGAGLAVLRMLVQEQVLRAEQLDQLFGLPVLGTIAELRLPGTRRFKAVELGALGLVALLFLGSFGSVVWLYQFQPVKPNVPALAADLKGELSRRLETFL